MPRTRRVPIPEEISVGDSSEAAALPAYNTIVISGPTTAVNFTEGFGGSITLDFGSSVYYTGTSNTTIINNAYYQEYAAEMIYHNAPTIHQFRAELNEVDRKIYDERGWIQRMSNRAKKRLRAQATECAKLLLEELFGYDLVEDGKYLRVNSKLHRDREYRIPVRGAMVKVLEEGKQTHVLCAHPSLSFGCPRPDHAIAQKLFLEASEKEFLDIAIRH